MTEVVGEDDAWEFAALDQLEYGGEPDLVNAAQRHVQAVMPEWEPRAGNTEVVLLEAFALMLGPEILALQMVPSAVVEQLVGLYGVTRSEGSPVTAQVRFTVTDSAPTQVVPEGTALRLQLSETGEVVDLETVEDLTILTSESRTGVVRVEATELGETGNGTPAGTEVEVLSLLTFVESAVLEVELTGGRGTEGDATFLARAGATLARQASTLVLPEHFTYAASATEGVARATTLDLTNPAQPGVEAAGHVTVAVAGPGGTLLGDTAREVIQGDLSSQALASLSVHVIDPTVTVVPVSLTVKVAVGADPLAVEGAVTAALEDWLDPDRWPWEPAVTEYGIVGAASTAPGVASVTSVQSGPMALPGLAPLAKAGVITVTLT